MATSQLNREYDRFSDRYLLRDPVWLGVIFEIIDDTDVSGRFQLIEPNDLDGEVHPSWSTLDRAQRYCQLIWEERY